jgi:GTP-binding protein
LEEGSRGFVKEIRGQALIAIEEADVIVMVVDVLDGITAADEEVADILRRSNKPIVLTTNKADNEGRMREIVEFYGLGLGDVYGISALHGLGTGDLLDAIVEALPAPPEFDPDEEDESIKIAIVGRPNVGKSSLLNKLLGQDRAIVSPIAGTTRDAVDTRINFNKEPITLIDTAGIRRRGRIAPGVEKFSVLRALRAIQRADVALLVIDATDGVTAQDLHVAGMVIEEMKSLVIVINKWDAIEKDSHTMPEFEKQLRQDFNFVPYAPFLFISAQTGQRIHQVLETAVLVYEERLRRVPTADLNRIVRRAVDRHAPASKHLTKLKIFYATQVRTDPPIFLFHVNKRNLVHLSYERYLENSLRVEYPFTGTPIRLSFRSRDGNEANSKEGGKP